MSWPIRSVVAPGALACALALLGCGGAPAAGGTTPSDPCLARREARERTSTALAQCRETSPPWRHEAVYGAASAELDALVAESGTIAPADAQRAADAIWELLDAVSPELTNHVSLDRAENAAEGVLRDREGDAARAAAQEARAALDALRQAAGAPSPTPCATEEAEASEASSAAAGC